MRRLEEEEDSAAMTPPFPYLYYSHRGTLSAYMSDAVVPA